MERLLVCVALTAAATVRADPAPAPPQQPHSPAPAQQPHYDLELRKDSWLSAAVERQNAEAGRVDPAWRSVARGVELGFRPDARIVNGTDSATLFTRQTLKFLGKSGVVNTPQLQHRADPAIADELRLERAYEDEPADWERVEIEVEVDDGGAVAATRIVEGSGKESIDHAALEAVQRALDARPLPHRATRVRFAVEAGVVVQPPTASKSMHDPRGRTVIGGMKFRFDETTGKVQARPWFFRRLVTRVSILSATNGAPPTNVK